MMSAIDIPLYFDTSALLPYYREEPLSQQVQSLLQARDWLFARKTALRSLEALHLACAVDRGAELLTADRLLAKGAKALGARFRYLGSEP